MPLVKLAAKVHLLVLPLLPAAAISVVREASGGTSVGHAEGQSKLGSTITFSEKDAANFGTALGVMNKAGVTRYQDHMVKQVKRSDGKFFWADSANRDENAYVGAKDLTESVSWGWHHPAGVYSTIPVGSPLFDDEMNIYVGADDAIRKFDANGVIKWAYAPRGQLAAAPSLCNASARRLVAPVLDEEALVRPDWDHGSQSSQGFQVGDLVKVKVGASFWADGKELFRAGDEGMITGDENGKVVIQWTRTKKKSVVQLHSMQERFTRVEQKKVDVTLSSMLIGSTTSGYVFAIDLASGDELWATWVSNEISGVKGSVGCKGGIVVVAAERCTDRYCYRYRNQTNPLTPGNAVVHGLSAVDGSSVWTYKTFQPMWNMVPLWGPGTSVMFQDWEGRIYSLDYLTGAQIFKVGGDIGTHTNANAVYDPGHNVVVALGVKHYENGRCNPYPAPGILPSCWTWPGTPGFIRGYNATSGRVLWERDTPEPPASGSVGKLNSPSMHTRLIVTLGHNCYLGSPSKLWALDPNTGDLRWSKEGPTLWTGFCAGDKEGADIRRAMGGREKCSPNSWSIPVIDAAGDLYIGNHVGALYKYGQSNGNQVQLLSTLNTGVATQDAAIAIGDGVMAVTTCTSLIVFQTYSAWFSNATWSVSHSDYSPIQNMVHGEDISHTISEEVHDDPTLTPKVDSDDIWSNDEPVYDPNIDGHTYNRRQAKAHTVSK
ncbi:unnamed protein product [Prorocentrum cordatum]|uniref:Pyrrolo-quinoline quinone repeat domain-containing protein n=1 Tax=Prorocentrum cordatum TaxID=2364126 RepID=A0ABN9PYG7_9DINO|nr:unnamed protein product [Polarella glacialis]